MSRNAKLDFYCWEYEFSVEGADQNSGLLPADASLQGWFPYFPLYREDLDGRLLYLYQPACGSPKVIQDDMAWMRAHPRPHFGEVFGRVDIRDEWKEYALVQTLHHVPLLEALEALVEVLKARDAKARARK